ncbi:MAG: hypothetical protein RL660_1783 [Bacteroidota bacterium]|jgi:hypothetical protein
MLKVLATIQSHKSVNSSSINYLQLAMDPPWRSKFKIENFCGSTITRQRRNDLIDNHQLSINNKAI